MDYRIEHPRFQQQNLTFRVAGAFSRSELLLNGEPLVATDKKKQNFEALDDQGVPTAVLVKNKFVDPIAAVTVDGDEISLAEPIQWYQWIWLAWPLSLLVMGGALGGALGAAAVMMNARLFRQETAPIMRYGLPAAISIGVVVVWLVIAVGLQLILG